MAINQIQYELLKLLSYNHEFGQFLKLIIILIKLFKQQN